MAQLSTIIGSILRDMIAAQHQANMYAVSMEEIYMKNGRLDRFPMPAVNIGEVEMELRYGVTDDDAQREQYEINYPLLRKLSEDVSLQLARIGVDSVLPVLKIAFAGDTTTEAEGLQKLTDDAVTRKNFCSFLSRKILKSMQRTFTSLINDDGTINGQGLTKLVIATLADHLLHHKDLEGLFAKTGGDMVREKARQEMETALNNMMPKILEDVNIKRKRLMPSVDVTVNSAELASLPDECVHTLKFSVSPNNIHLYTDDNQ